MHVARISHLFYPDIRSDYLLELSKRQTNIGHKVSVLTWNKNKRANEAYSDSLKIYRLSGVNFSIKGMFEAFPYLPSLPQEINRLKPDIVHAESHLFLTSLQAIMRAKKLGIRSVVTVHGVMAKRNIMVDYAQYAYLNTLGSKVFKNADKVICLTKNDAKEIMKLGCTSDKVAIIPNAVDTHRFYPRQLKDVNLVTWVGRFVTEKGLRYLIEAARLVVKDFKNVHFLLIGYGGLKDELISLASKYALLDNISFASSLCRDEIADILGRSSVFAFPSLKEGMPIAVLEAMSAENAVVAFDIPGLNEIIRNNYNGLLVPPCNSNKLAAAILGLLVDNSTARKLGKRARETVASRYSWEVLLESLNNVYSAKSVVSIT